MCCDMLQCVEMCWNVLQCASMCCDVLQCVAIGCDVLRCIVIVCDVLRCIVLCYDVLWCVAMGNHNMCKLRKFSSWSINKSYDQHNAWLARSPKSSYCWCRLSAPDDSDGDGYHHAAASWACFLLSCHILHILHRNGAEMGQADCRCFVEQWMASLQFWQQFISC